MKKYFGLLLLLCSAWAINSCSDDSTPTAPTPEVTYNEIKDLPNSLLCTVDHGNYQWILHPNNLHAYVTANGISLVGERYSEEGNTTIAMTIPLQKGTGFSSNASITINKTEPYRIFQFYSNSMKVSYNLKFCCDSLIYGTFSATAKSLSGSIISITNGTFKSKVTQFR